MNILEEARSLGLQISLVDAETVAVEPGSKTPPDLRRRLIESKAEIIEDLWANPPAVPTSTNRIPKPGDELRKIIPAAIAWLFRSGDCSCRATAKKMNQWGVGRCIANRDWIVEQITNEAGRLGKTELAARTAAGWVNRAIDRCRMSAVWVYADQPAVADELRWSMRSAAIHLSDLSQIVLCGDRPNWYDGAYIHVPRYDRSQAIVDRIPRKSHRYCAWIEQARKLRAIADDPNVTENFLWMYDDSFIMQPCEIRDLAVPRASSSNLFCGNVNQKSRDKWREIKRRTLLRLQSEGLPTRNYSSHYPVVYNKSRLRETLDRFVPNRHPFVIESLYLNHHFPRSQCCLSTMFQYIDRFRKWSRIRPGIRVLNIGNFNSAAQSRLKPLFPRDGIPSGLNIDL